MWPSSCLKPSSSSFTGFLISLFLSLCKHYQHREAFPEWPCSSHCCHFLSNTQPCVHITEHMQCTHARMHVCILQPPPTVLFSDITACFLNCIYNMWFLFWFLLCTCGIHFLHVDMNSEALGTYLLSTVGLTAHGLLPDPWEVLTKHSLCWMELALFYITFSTELKIII